MLLSLTLDGAVHDLTQKCKHCSWYTGAWERMARNREGRNEKLRRNRMT